VLLRSSSAIIASSAASSAGTCGDGLRELPGIVTFGRFLVMPRRCFFAWVSVRRDQHRK
jgi:hypothetical protein